MSYPQTTSQTMELKVRIGESLIHHNLLRTHATNEAKGIVCDEYSAVITRDRITRENMDAWMLVRGACITASDIGVILGVNKYVKGNTTKRWTTLKYKKNKARFATAAERKNSRTQAMSYGLKWEETALKLFTEVTGIPVDSNIGFIRHSENRYIGATPDAICLTIPALVEVKCPYRRGIDIRKDIDESHLLQMYCQMYVTGINYCYYVEYKRRKKSYKGVKNEMNIRLVNFKPLYWQARVLPSLKAFRVYLAAPIPQEWSDAKRRIDQEKQKAHLLQVKNTVRLA